MGIYLNLGNDMFSGSVKGEIYVDKTELVAYVNQYIKTPKKFICISRTRRFGKLMAAHMQAAYYGKDLYERLLIPFNKLSHTVR